MGVIDVVGVSYTLPGGIHLLTDVSFRVGDGEHVALVGANGVGKTTLLRLLAGDTSGHTGTVRVDGSLGVMRQFIGSVADATTVRELLLSLAGPRLQEVGDWLAKAEASGDGVRYAVALSDWGDAGGYEAEVLWDTATTLALGQPLDRVGSRPVAELSGGEQKRLALEVLLRGDADVLLLDEPDNFLDVPAKRWLEDALNATSKTVLLVSHDRQLLASTAQRVVTLEANGAWTHGGSFETWHDARSARIERLEEEHRRFREERQRLEDSMREFRRRATMSDKFASRLRASETKLRRFEAAAPPKLPSEQRIMVRLGGDRTGKRAVTVESLSFPGIVQPFDADVFFGERVAVLGRNGTGKSHFLRLLGGENVDHRGRWLLGARVVPGSFSQTHTRPDLVGHRVIGVLESAGLARGPAMATLKRYELDGCADQTFETLSGGQQARLQVLLLELSGATLLLLDEPTDNLDVASAEALESAIGDFEGTVIAVTHDRWFVRSFDRFLVFRADGSVVASLEPVWD